MNFIPMHRPMSLGCLFYSQQFYTKPQLKLLAGFTCDAFIYARFQRKYRGNSIFGHIFIFNIFEQQVLYLEYDVTSVPLEDCILIVLPGQFHLSDISNTCLLCILVTERLSDIILLISFSYL
ncbi:hypothetical protein CHS0354_012683 [Potamilus streckersoni]|uniref:Uncharacterized protein n=1 Tax=Potamilus streckersoni TaxID=2493646 RepID=A0AAE0W4K2_9BIVA|nr:hypothetical protein CHS0354_012683 [Potamilus streckersoni]